MTKLTEQYAASQGQPLFILDVSPPRGNDLAPIRRAGEVSADFFCVAYSPGKSVRVDSTVIAHLIKQEAGKEVIFNLACRDMNKLALQNHLLGAQLLGLDNVLVIKGDDFTEAERTIVKDVNDFAPTALMQAIKSLNEGKDYKGLQLRSPTNFCIGAVIDLNRGVEREARLTRRKVAAGAEFFITQAFYDIGNAQRFLETYHALIGEELATPIFYGVQILDKDGPVFGDVPQNLQEDLAKGRPGTGIALELLHSYADHDMNTVYLIPAILRGGRRDYAAAQEVLEAFR